LFIYTHIWYILGSILLVPGLLLLKGKSKISYILIFIALILYGLNYYQIYKESNRFDAQNAKMAQGIDFDLYMPTKYPGGVRAVAATGFPNNPYLAIEDLIEFSRSKTKNTSGNCGPWSPEMETMVNPHCDFYARVPLGSIYSDQTKVYLTIGNTRIAMIAGDTRKEDIIEVFSSLKKTPKENIDFFNRRAPTLGDAFIYGLMYLKAVLAGSR